MVWEDETDGHVGVKCWAGCSRKTVCDALGISETDLYISNNQYKPQHHPKGPSILDLAIDKGIHPHLWTTGD